MLGYCGLSYSGAVSLRRRHVDVKRKELTIRRSATAVTGKGMVETDTKTKKTRQVPVPEPVWKRPKAELPDDPDALVFPSRNRGYLPLGEYRWTFDKACAGVCIDGLTPHDLRHTTASLAISAGAT